MNTLCRWLGKWSEIILRDTRMWSKSSLLRSVIRHGPSSVSRTWRIRPGKYIGGGELGSLLEVVEVEVVVVEVMKLVALLAQ